MKKIKNLNHPTRGSCIKVNPIKSLRVIRNIENALKTHPRNYAIFKLGIHTSLPPKELLNLRYGQIIFEQGQICLKVNQNSNGNGFSIHLNQPCFEAIHNLIDSKKDVLDTETFLFTGSKGILTVSSLNNLVKRWCRHANLKSNYGALSLRKTFGFHQLVQGISLKHVMMQLGHTSIGQTLDYLCISKNTAQALKTKNRSNLAVTPSSYQASIIRQHEKTIKGLKSTINQLQVSEERLKTIFENAYDEIMYVGTDGTIIDVNEKVKDLFGYERDEVIGKPFTDFNFLEKNELKKMVKSLENSLKGISSPPLHEYKGIRKDQTTVYFEATATPIVKNDQIKGFIAIVRDVSQRKQMELSLKEGGEMARALLNATTDAAMLLDSEGVILDLNTAYAIKIQKPVGKLKGACIWDLIPFFATKLKKDVAWVFATGKSLRFEDRFQNIWTDNVIYPISDATGKVIRIAIFSHDTTKQRAAEAALKRHRDSLEILIKERTIELEETNAALKVLLKQREEDKQELEEKLLFNVMELILPNLQKLHQSRLHARQKGYLETIETDLKEIISPFSRNLSSKYFNLTPTELHVANFIKHGKTTKEIANQLSLSENTIQFHRTRIRRKLGISNKRMNLRSYLQSIKNKD